MNARGTLLTKREVSALIGVPPGTVAWWGSRRIRAFPAPMLVCTGGMGRSKAMWPLAELEAWLQTEQGQRFGVKK